MRHYETIFIVTPVLSDADLKNTIKSYVDFIKNNGGEIVHEENWGLRQLAYPIKNKSNGYYHEIQFQAPGEIIDRLELSLKRDENIIRFLTTKLDKHAVEHNERKRKGEDSVNKMKEKEEA